MSPQPSYLRITKMPKNTDPSTASIHLTARLTVNKPRDNIKGTVPSPEKCNSNIRATYDMHIIN